MPLDTTELLRPIPGAAPGGASLRYEPIYDQIRRARTEEDDLPTGDWQRERKTADYGTVIKLSQEVLSKRSKDLQVAAWLTEALLKREGFAGLREGIDLIRGMLETFWDDLHPELEEDDVEMRAAPLTWIGEYLDRAARLVPITLDGHTIAQYRDSRLVGYEADASSYEKRDQRNAAIAQGRLTAEEVDAAFSSTPKAWYRDLVSAIDGALEAIPALERVSDEKFGRDAPRFSPLVDAIREVRQVAVQLLERKRETEPDPVEAAAPAAEAEPAPASSTDGSSPAAPSISVPSVFAAPAAFGAAPAGTPGTRAGVETDIAAAARFLRRESATNPAPYLLLRGFRWGELRAGRDGLDPRLLPAPPTDIRTQLKSLLMMQKWPELLESAEEVMATPFGRGWLDLQRYVVTAADGLGEDYHPVAAAVRGALKSALFDLPELVSVTLADDTPTANPETLGWLRSEGLLGDAGDADAAEAPARTSRTRSDVHARASQLAAAGKHEQAVDLLMREAAQERSSRGRFLRRTQAAAILVDAGLAPVALPILEEISATIEEHKLEEWEDAETVARPLGLLYQCHVAIDGDGSGVHQLFLRVCRLDPMQAMKFGPASPG